MIYWLIEAEPKDQDLTKINYETNMKSHKWLMDYISNLAKEKP